MVKAVKGKLKLLGLIYVSLKTKGLSFKSLEIWNKTLLVKHLWNVASKKESLWVKWINVVKLKNRSVWDIDVDTKDSWSWKCILNLRELVGNHMRYKIGEGKSINVWHDKWNSGTALSSIISKKEIFYVGFQDSSCISAIIYEHGWKWPQSWLEKYDCLNNIDVPVLSNQPNVLIWVDNNGKEMRFSTSNVWNTMRGNNDKVCWKDLVWHSNCIPKHTFILWLAVKGKLCTQDKLARRYSNNNFECSLCKKEADSHDHLFFKCDYAQKLWKMVSDISKSNVHDDNWEDIVKNMSKEKSKRNIWGNIRKLSFVAIVYHIWQERNWRLFNNCKRSEVEVFGTLCDDLKARLTFIIVKQSANVIQGEQVWQIKFLRKSSG